MASAQAAEGPGFEETDTSASPSPGPGARLHGLEPLRALLALAVIAWHTRVLGRSAVGDPGRSAGPPDAVALFNYQVLCVAVPAFFLVSLFLYVRRRAGRPRALRERVGYLASLYAFWMGAFLLAQGGLRHLRRTFEGDPLETAGFLLTAGGTPFYFLVCLLLLTVVADLSQRASARFLVVLFVGSLALLVGQQAAAVTWKQAAYATAYTNPANFLPYAFLAVWLHRRVGEGGAHELPVAWILAAAAASAALAAIEWAWLPHANHFGFNDSALPPYTRLSLVASSGAVLLLALRIRGPANAAVRWVGGASLGLYCLHPFVMSLVHPYLAPIRGGWDRGVFFAWVCGVSLAGVAVLRRILRQRLL